MKFNVGDIVVVIRDIQRPHLWNHRHGEEHTVISFYELDKTYVVKSSKDKAKNSISARNLRKLTKLEKALK